MICTYQDYATEEGVETSSLADKTDQESSDQIFFPEKLHKMLNQVEMEGLSHVVGWAPHGRCFIVRDKNEFASRILTSWFRQSKFASFQRQLNLYGYKRITTGPDKGGYYHELFLRGKVFLCHRMERVKIKGSKPGRIKAYADAEPDFYRMRPLPASGDGTNHQPEDGRATPSQAETGGEPPPTRAETSAQAATTSSSDARNPARTTQAPGMQSNEGNLPFSDPNTGRAGGISFLVSEPQPMPVARSLPLSSSFKLNDPKRHTTDAIFSSLPDGSPSIQAPGFNASNALNMMSVQSFLASNLKQAKAEQVPGRGNQTGTSSTVGASFVNVHALRQGIGRTSLAHLGAGNAEIFGGTPTTMPPLTAPGGQQQDLPPFLMSSRPDQVSTLLELPDPSSNSAASFAAASGHPIQSEDPILLASGIHMMPPYLNVPNNDFMHLSESLPTAQALALEDLFDHDDGV